MGEWQRCAHYACDELDCALCSLSFVVSHCRPPTPSLAAGNSQEHISAPMGGCLIHKRNRDKSKKSHLQTLEGKVGVLITYLCTDLIFLQILVIKVFNTLWETCSQGHSFRTAPARCLDKANSGLVIPYNCSFFYINMVITYGYHL